MKDISHIKFRVFNENGDKFAYVLFRLNDLLFVNNLFILADIFISKNPNFEGKVSRVKLADLFKENLEALNYKITITPNYNVKVILNNTPLEILAKDIKEALNKAIQKANQLKQIEETRIYDVEISV